MNLLKTWKANLFSLHTKPLDIALGFSIGSFIALLPTPGFGILLGAAVLLAYPKLNKIALFSAFALFNPLVLTPIYLASWRLGDYLFATRPAVAFHIEVLNVAYHYTIRFLVGNIIIALLSSLMLFSVVFALSSFFQRRKKSA